MKYICSTFDIYVNKTRTEFFNHNVTISTCSLYGNTVTKDKFLYVTLIALVTTQPVSREKFVH